MEMAATSRWLWWTLLFANFVTSSHPDQKNIPAEFGQAVTLPCRAPNNNIIVVEWSRADLRPEFLFVYQNEQFDPENQHASFRNRVDLQDRQMKDGDVSVILKDVTVNDIGTYECRVLMEGTSSLELIRIIYLRVVAPPGQTGALTGDGGKEEGSGPVMSVGVFVVVIAVASVVVGGVFGVGFAVVLVGGAVVGGVLGAAGVDGVVSVVVVVAVGVFVVGVGVSVGSPFSTNNNQQQSEDPAEEQQSERPD